MADNPYLAHLHPSQRVASKSDLSSSISAAAKEPLFGFVPRNVKGDAVRKAMVSYNHILTLPFIDLMPCQCILGA
jgi:hypothetical protein